MDLLRFETILLLLSVGGGLAQDVLPHGTLYVEQGQNVTFKTTADLEKSFITIVWSKHSDQDGLEPLISLAGTVVNVVEGYVGRAWLNRTNGRLKMGPTTAADDGEYSVSMVDDKAFTQTGERELRVLVAVSSVLIASSPLEALETNSTVVLNCSALGSLLTFSWTNGTTPLLGDGKRTSISNGEQWSSVTIREVNRWELRGPIGCSATNKLEKTINSAPFNMSVHYGPEAVKMAVPAVAAGGFVARGSNMTLSCSAASGPPAALSWFHNGKALPGKTGPTLVLSDIGLTQGGKYHCSAHNAKTLRTVDTPSISFSVMEAISGATVTGPAAGQLAGVAGGVNLTCGAAAGEVAQWAWLKDGAALPKDGRTTLAANGSMLRLLPLAKEHRGVYTCTLKNAVNSVKAAYTLVVFYGPDSLTIRGESAVEVNDELTLTCSLDSDPPAAIKWRFNNTARTETTKVLTFAKVAYRDTGLYTCQAYNAKTQRNASSTFMLSVKEEGALDPEGLTGGAIAGIVIGVLAAVLLAVGAFIYCKRKQTIESPY
ncbi:unnamed protein product [Boreogadus saida]